MTERIQKLLAHAGVGSRRFCEELVRQGRVKINGRIARIGDVTSKNDILLVDGHRVNAEKKVYVMLYKPKGHVSTVHEQHQMKKVIDLIDVEERIYPVGRLDKSAEGLLLLTNDGELANTLTHPRYGVEKEYFVRLGRPLSSRDLKKLQHGIKVEGIIVKAICKKTGKDALLLTLREGRKHIVKKLLGRIGHSVVFLKRIRIGPLMLTGVKRGRWRFLTAREVNMLKKISTSEHSGSP